MFSNQETMALGLEHILDSSMLPEIPGANTITADAQLDECVKAINANNDSSVTKQSYDEGEQDFSKFTLKGANFGKKRKARNVSM